MKESFKKKLLRSRLKWSVHVERMGDDKLAKRTDSQKVKGNRRRGRPRRRWEDCVKRGVESVGGEWRTTAKDRRSWIVLIENVGEKGEERNNEEKTMVTMATMITSPLTTETTRDEQQKNILFRNIV